MVHYNRVASDISFVLISGTLVFVEIRILVELRYVYVSALACGDIYRLAEYVTDIILDRQNSRSAVCSPPANSG